MSENKKLYFVNNVHHNNKAYQKGSECPADLVGEMQVKNLVAPLPVHVAPPISDSEQVAKLKAENAALKAEIEKLKPSENQKSDSKSKG